jgi:hypothetical protein
MSGAAGGGAGGSDGTAGVEGGGEGAGFGVPLSSASIAAAITSSKLSRLATSAVMSIVGVGGGSGSTMGMLVPASRSVASSSGIQRSSVLPQEQASVSRYLSPTGDDVRGVSVPQPV